MVCSSILERTESHQGFLNYSRIPYILSTVLLSLSNTLLLFAFATFWKFDRNLRSTGKQLIMNLCVALVLAQTMLMIKGIPWVCHNACIPIAVAGHYLWLAVFSSTTALALDLHRRFGVTSTICKLDQTAEDLVKFILFAWGMPLLIVVPCVCLFFTDTTFSSFNLSYGGDSCWLGDGRANLYFFGLPIGSFMLTNFILFVMVAIGLHRVRRNSALHNVHGAESGLSSDLLIYVKVKVHLTANIKLYQNELLLYRGYEF